MFVLHIAWRSSVYKFNLFAFFYIYIWKNLKTVNICNNYLLSDCISSDSMQQSQRKLFHRQLQSYTPFFVYISRPIICFYLFFVLFRSIFKDKEQIANDWSAKDQNCVFKHPLFVYSNSNTQSQCALIFRSHTPLRRLM